MSPTKDQSVKAVTETMEAYARAITDKDFDALMDLLSDDFKDSHGFGKKDWKERNQKMTGLEVELDDATATVDGDSAIFAPLVVNSSWGPFTYKHTLKKESDGAWRVIYTETIDWENVPMDAEARKIKAEIDASAMAASLLRDKLLSDPARPGYHFVMPEGIAIPFDPNGAIFWKGRYHLFYIFQDKRTGKKSDHWGHVSSTDLFHWRHHPTGLLEGMYSGNAFVNEDGVPTICYHQVGEGNAMAVALDDDLNEWQKLDSNPITPKTEEGDEHHGKYRSWDPHAWLEGDTYYAIFGGKHPGIARSPTLAGEWQYVGDLFAHGVEGVELDEDVSCADLFKLGDRDMLLCISHRLGARYYLGEWKDEQYYPEFHAQMSWVDNAFFAPESMKDDKGRRIMWAWLLDYRQFGVRWEHGWSGTMCLPRVLSLDEDGQLLMEVAEEIEALRYNAIEKDAFELQADADIAIDDVSGNSLELFVEMDSSDAAEYGVKVCVSPDGQEETVISYDAGKGELKVDTHKSGPEEMPKSVEAGPFKLNDGEQLELRIFVDKSVVEVFANRRQAVMRRIYPSRADSLGVSLFARGGSARVHTLKSWTISPSNPY